jgi:hypothetical protein
MLILNVNHLNKHRFEYFYYLIFQNSKADKLIQYEKKAAMEFLKNKNEHSRGKILEDQSSN